jgi:hypothetical protein
MPYIQFPSITLQNGINNDQAAQQVTVTLGAGVSEYLPGLSGGSIGSASLFDGQYAGGVSEHFNLTDVNSQDELFTVAFSPAIQSLSGKIKLRVSTRLTDTYSFTINNDNNKSSGTLAGSNGTSYIQNEVEFLNTTELSSIEFTMEDASSGAGTKHEIHEIEIFIDNTVEEPNFQKFIRTYTPEVIPNVIAIGLPESSSTYDTTTFTVDNRYRVVDGDPSTFLGLDDSGDGSTGFIVDLREPRQIEHGFDPTTDITLLDATDLGGNDIGTTVSNPHYINNAIDNFATITPGASTAIVALQVDFGERGIILDKFDFGLGDSYSQGLSWAFSVTNVGEEVAEPLRFFPTTVGTDAIDTIHWQNGTDPDTFNPNHGFVQKGNVSRVKTLFIFTVVSSATPVKIAYLRPYAVKYSTPQGVNLKSISAKLYGGNVSSTYDWDIDFSSDNGNTYTQNPVYTITTSGTVTSQAPVQRYPVTSSELITHFRLTQDGDENGDQHFARIYEISYSHQPFPSIETNFDFNDTILTTKGWNSSRYDGKQLSGAKINEFTEGDSTYGKSPVIERYTRNIYIGNEVVSLNNDSIEDNTLLPINNFSYIQSNYYITVNEDGSITHNRLKPTTLRSFKKTGFYQSFYDDFPLGKGCRLIIYDPSVKNNLKPSYPIYFNGGQLQQLIKYYVDHVSFIAQSPSIEYVFDELNFTDKYDIETFVSTNNTIKFKGYGYEFGDSGEAWIHAGVTVLNFPLFRRFYPGNNIIPPPITVNPGPLALHSHIDVYKKAFEYKNNSDYINDKRFFLSIMESGSSGSPLTPIRTIASGSVIDASSPFRTNNLAEISTVEITSASIENSTPAGGGDLIWHVSPKTGLNQEYGTTDYSSDGGTNSIRPAIAKSAPVIISQVDDSVPSLLVNLDKSVELKDGPGDLPFIIVPENLHPYIEDNLTFYLSKAGINVSGDATQTNEEITTKKPRVPRLTPGQRKAIARGRRRRKNEEEESNRERRQRERRERRKNRKEDRQERKENRQENRNKRKENRQERKNNRQENRQDRRNDRKKNRRNRRRNK